MCQGEDPKYFQFKPAPEALTAGALANRFLQVDPLPGKNGEFVEYSLRTDAPCPVIDAHVHVFPPTLMEAVWSFYENFYWPVRYKAAYRHNQAEFLLNQGVSHVVLLVYAHKDGISRGLNRFLSTMVTELNTRYAANSIQANHQPTAHRRRVATGLGTVMPGEPGAVDILTEAFTTLGLSGIKMHSHVQCLAANDPRMDEVYETCIRFNKPCLIHAGLDPNSKAYKVDITDLCGAKIIEDVLRRFPKLKLCVPHLGMNQYQEFFDLLDKYPNLYLDTTFTFASFLLPLTGPTPESYGSAGYSENVDFKVTMRKMLLKHNHRIFYGTDFPHMPFDFCRELANLVSLMDQDPLEASHPLVTSSTFTKGQKRSKLGDDALENILWRNAARFYNISKHELGWEQGRHIGAVL